MLHSISKQIIFHHKLLFLVIFLSSDCLNIERIVLFSRISTSIKQALNLKCDAAEGGVGTMYIMRSQHLCQVMLRLRVYEKDSMLFNKFHAGRYSKYFPRRHDRNISKHSQHPAQCACCCLIHLIASPASENEKFD